MYFGLIRGNRSDIKYNRAGWHRLMPYMGYAVIVVINKGIMILYFYVRIYGHACTLLGAVLCLFKYNRCALITLYISLCTVFEMLPKDLKAKCHLMYATVLFASRLLFWPWSKTQTTVRVIYFGHYLSRVSIGNIPLWCVPSYILKVYNSTEGSTWLVYNALWRDMSPSSFKLCYRPIILFNYI